MKIIVAGSRDVTDYVHVRNAFIVSGYWKEFGKSIEVISGAARGADRLGEEFAEKNGLIVHRFPADWDILGKRAGIVRNIEMGQFAKEHDGRLLALWDGVSRGTLQMIEWARDNGLKGFVYRTDKPVRYARNGSFVQTDYSGRTTKHRIVAIERNTNSQSGVMFQVSPAVPKSGGKDAWIDADWFEYMEEE